MLFASACVWYGDTGNWYVVTHGRYLWKEKTNPKQASYVKMYIPLVIDCKDVIIIQFNSTRKLKSGWQDEIINYT